MGFPEAFRMKKIVLTYGTFDLFHTGHLNLLNRLKAMGDELVVGVTTDEFNALRGKQTIFRFEDRMQIIRNLKCVDLAISLQNAEQKADDIRRYDVSIFGMGNDWEGRFDDLRVHCEVIYLPRTENISSTHIKKLLEALDRFHVSNAGKALDPTPSIVGLFDEQIARKDDR
jgi:glycerol-3-phosphate cytidylyltransferase